MVYCIYVARSSASNSKIARGDVLEGARASVHAHVVGGARLGTAASTAESLIANMMVEDKLWHEKSTQVTAAGVCATFYNGENPGRPRPAAVLPIYEAAAKTSAIVPRRAIVVGRRESASLERGDNGHSATAGVLSGRGREADGRMLRIQGDPDRSVGLQFTGRGRGVPCCCTLDRDRPAPRATARTSVPTRFLLIFFFRRTPA